MEAFDHVERDLNSHYHTNNIYFLGDKEKYHEVERLLEYDYGFLDIVLDFKDFDRLSKIFDKLPKDETQRKVIKNMIISDYLNYVILTGAGINSVIREVAIPKIGESLFKGDLKAYYEVENLFFNCDIFGPIKERLEALGLPHARIHFLLDDVTDKRLQKCINDLFTCPSDIAMMGYTSSDLITYKTTGFTTLDTPEYYNRIISDAKFKKISKERRNKNDKY